MTLEFDKTLDLTPRVQSKKCVLTLNFELPIHTWKTLGFNSLLIVLRAKIQTKTVILTLTFFSYSFKFSEILKRLQLVER